MRLDTMPHADAQWHAATGTRVLTRLPGTVDSGRFVQEDMLSVALTPSSGPHVGGLSSRNVKNRRLTIGEATLIPGVNGGGGVSGGFVEGALADPDVRWGNADRKLWAITKKQGNVTGKNARKRAARKARVA